jgi:alanine dehydrogenase
MTKPTNYHDRLEAPANYSLLINASVSTQERLKKPKMYINLSRAFPGQKAPKVVPSSHLAHWLQVHDLVDCALNRGGQVPGASLVGFIECTSKTHGGASENT